MIVIPARDLESVRPRTNDERRVAWAARYFGGGHHHHHNTFMPACVAPPDLPSPKGAAQAGPTPQQVATARHRGS